MVATAWDGWDGLRFIDGQLDPVIVDAEARAAGYLEVSDKRRGYLFKGPDTDRAPGGS